MIFQQLGEFLCRRFLQHLLQHVGRTTVTDEDPVVLGHGSIKPQTIANHICIRNFAKSLGGTDIYVATDNHCRQSRRSLLHHTLIERQLQIHQRLREALASFPAKHRDRRQHLSTDSIGWQALALSAGMQNDAPLALQPIGGLLKHPRGSPTRPQPMANRVAGAEIFVTRKSRHLMETFNQIRG